MRWFPVIVFTAVSAFSASTGVAAVSASLSEQVIDELETVRLTIRASQTRKTETLDLTALEQDFHVMGTNTSSQYTFRNGRERSWVDYQITLQPKRTGDITIPSIQVGLDQTPTITLTVRPLTDETREMIDELVFFEQELSAQAIYVQGQLLIKRRLLYSNGVQLYSDLPGPPELENAVVVTLGDPVSSTTERAGRTYGVVEQNYAIFPELSGSLDIPPISLTASVRLISNGRVTRKGVRVGTEAATITVNPVPASYPPDKPWIPATDVQLNQVLTPDITEYKVGDTINHELLIFIEGNLGSIAPPIDLALNNSVFRVYPQSPVIDDDPQRLGVVGSRRQTASVLPLTGGRHALPEVSVTWWDTQTDQLRVTTWAEQKVNVVGETVATQPQVTDDDLRAAAAQLESSDQEETPSSLALNFDRLWLLWAAGAVTLLLVAYWLTRWLLARLGRQGTAPAERHNKRQIAQLLQTMDAAEPSQALDNLDSALALKLSLTKAGAREKFLDDYPQAGEYIDQLNKAAYGASSTPAPVESVNALRKLASHYNTRKPRRPPALPPLYPHQQLPS